MINKVINDIMDRLIKQGVDQLKLSAKIPKEKVSDEKIF